MTSPNSRSFDARDLIHEVRDLYLERQTARIELRHSTGLDTFFFRQGELHLDRDHIAGPRIAPLLEALEPGQRSASHPELRGEVEWLARELTTHHDPQAERIDETAGAVELVGPLPTLCFLMELSVHGCDEEELVRRLGGAASRLHNSDVSPALEQLPGLEPEMAEVMVALERPVPLSELLRGATVELSRLRAVTKLWSLGLVRSEVAQEKGNDEPLVTPRMLRSFSERIASRLESDPVDLGVEEHRQRVAELLAKLGDLDHYQLLELDTRSGPDEISVAYNALASVVHPDNARRLGFEGREEAMRVLFERATEAYLTLSDPRRRASYNTMSGITVEQEVDDAQRHQEKRDLARQNYLRATNSIDMMEYSTAVDLLKEAVRLDPQPEYLARLGVAQSKNPHWLQHAVANFERAVEMSPDDAGIRVAFGKVLEDLERNEEARREYGAALDLMPDNIAARDGLDRLGGAAAPRGAGDFKSLFSRNR